MGFETLIGIDDIEDEPETAFLRIRLEREVREEAPWIPRGSEGPALEESRRGCCIQRFECSVSVLVIHSFEVKRRGWRQGVCKCARPVFCQVETKMSRIITMREPEGLSFMMSIRIVLPERSFPFLPPGVLSPTSRMVASRSMRPALRKALVAMDLEPAGGAETDMIVHQEVCLIGLSRSRTKSRWWTV